MISKTVVERNPFYLKQFCEDLIRSGNHVIIISGERQQETYRKLKTWKFQENVSFTDIVSVSEIVLEKCPSTEIEFDYYNNLWIDDTLWGEYYAEICENYKVQIFLSEIDDYFSFIPDSIIKLRLEI